MKKLDNYNFFYYILKWLIKIIIIKKVREKAKEYYKNIERRLG